MGAVGTATINFGAAPGANVASVAVTGQAAIAAGAHCEAWFMGDATASHNAVAHMLIFPQKVGLVCSDVVPGTGFTITAQTELRLNGTVQVHWVWSA